MGDVIHVLVSIASGLALRKIAELRLQCGTPLPRSVYI